MSEARWALFLSGRGSNAQVVMDLQAYSQVRLVVSNNSQAPGVRRALRSGIPVLITPKKIDWLDLQQELSRRNINRIFLLGFMRLIPESFISLYHRRIFNLHPSLLPAFPGLEAIDKSFNQGAAMGVTVHEVVPEMDAGPILLQKQVLPASREGRHALTLSEAQFLISLAEQQLVREAFLKLAGETWKQ